MDAVGSMQRPCLHAKHALYRHTPCPRTRVMPVISTESMRARGGAHGDGGGKRENGLTNCDSCCARTGGAFCCLPQARRNLQRKLCNPNACIQRDILCCNPLDSAACILRLWAETKRSDVSCAAVSRSRQPTLQLPRPHRPDACVCLGTIALLIIR